MSECTAFVVVPCGTLVAEPDALAKVIAYLEYTLLAKCKKQRKTDYASCYLASSTVETLLPWVAPVTSKHIAQTVTALNDGGEQSSDGGLEALALALNKIRERFPKTRNRAMLRNIVVFADPDAWGKWGGDYLELWRQIRDDLEQDSVRLVLLDCGEGTFSPPSPPLRRLIHTIYTRLIEDTLGFNPASVKPVRVFSGVLRLGATLDTIVGKQEEDAQSVFEDPLSLAISVEGFPATKTVQGLNRKTMVKTTTEDASFEYVPVKSVIEYTTKEESGRGAVSVSSQNVTKAYRYGADYVVLPDTIVDRSVYRTGGPAAIDIRGFMDVTALPRHYLHSESIFILPDSRTGGVADETTFHVLVDAMLQAGKLAIARYVNRDRGSDVQMCALVALVTSTQHSSGSTLVLTRLPFAEDQRNSLFPPLTPKLPDDADSMETDALMEQFVDSMDTDKIGIATKDEYYYSTANLASGAASTLPLPEGEHYSHMNDQEDPLRVPSVAVHRLQEVTMEWLLQRVIEPQDDGEEFVVPELPPTLADKISSYVSDQGAYDRTAAALVARLGCHKSAQVKGSGQEQRDNTEDNVQEGPPLEELLRRGER
ncbi:ATP-dependent DNA helicase YKU80 KNAG_0E02380 [Huiozyma naganishii CBS 8797]|uniref:ATP-dependent DNA helicase II subunit 2 n=1 Tax=Huiozyma naganishii (strain ATCC MYA-139 / BCRC 22969 / CBS 8797 / KCTC 17520 / NBRC 10181 / NCYC 3082 / Yp74L-3) TaxID=1071383 RepID=J7S6Q2_HUIN7|nr:hypothetical protein KNAG_0E02380 [Kazachstania naganishii CBS 8797]CCK70499.1 hypothetical protein KNAG_0E02380 [Kazachstania naganishii CBS 8797]